MIEDKANNVLEISDHIPVLCFDAPYNIGIEKNNIQRGLDEFFKKNR